MSEYEKVEDISVGEVAQLRIEGTYTFYQIDSDEYVEVPHNILELHYVIENYDLYARKESPWWEGCEGSVIMVHGKHEDNWYPIILDRVDENSNYPYKSNRTEYMFARPLTTAERDAIKVRD